MCFLYINMFQHAYIRACVRVVRKIITFLDPATLFKRIVLDNVFVKIKWQLCRHARAKRRLLLAGQRLKNYLTATWSNCVQCSADTNRVTAQNYTNYLCQLHAKDKISMLCQLDEQRRGGNLLLSLIWTMLFKCQKYFFYDYFYIYCYYISNTHYNLTIQENRADWVQNMFDKNIRMDTMFEFKPTNYEMNNKDIYLTARKIVKILKDSQNGDIQS